MSFTEEHLMAQEELINELEQELQRLNGNFDALLKEAKLSVADLKSTDTASLSPELRAAYDEAVTKAQREGKARSSQFENASTTGSVPGSGRKDVIRL